MAEVLVLLSTLALMAKNKMVSSATPNAKKATTGLAQSAGKTAKKATQILELTASSQTAMAEDLAICSGTRTSVTLSIKMWVDVRSGASYGIPSAKLASIMSLAASAPPIAT